MADNNNNNNPQLKGQGTDGDDKSDCPLSTNSGNRMMDGDNCNESDNTGGAKSSDNNLSACDPSDEERNGSDACAENDLEEDDDDDDDLEVDALDLDDLDAGAYEDVGYGEVGGEIDAFDLEVGAYEEVECTEVDDEEEDDVDDSAEESGDDGDDGNEADNEEEDSLDEFEGHIDLVRQVEVPPPGITNNRRTMLQWMHSLQRALPQVQQNPSRRNTTAGQVIVAAYNQIERILRRLHLSAECRSVPAGQPRPIRRCRLLRRQVRMRSSLRSRPNAYWRRVMRHFLVQRYRYIRH